VGGGAGRLPGDRTRPERAWLHFAADRQRAGLPERRSRMLPVLLVLAVGLGAVAGAVADRFASPAQVAAKAAPPAPSLITARARFGVLSAIVQLRADVSTGDVVTVRAPGDLGGSLPVVTSVAVAAGQRVAPGQLLVTVAQRPVFVFAGLIPAFRAMSPGMTGPDVAELQAGLAAAGFGAGEDTLGVYGPGTSAAVSAFYKANGVTPVVSPQVGGRQTGAVVPLGEVAFVPHLPASVVSVDQLGSTAGPSVAQLVSGKATLTASAEPAQVSLLRAGMSAMAVSDVSGTDFAVRVSSFHGSQVVFVPAGQLPSGMAGQNVQVTVTTSVVKALIVPVAAVSTSGSGQTLVTVRIRGGTVQVPVRLGLASGGEQAVSPMRPGALRSGDLVVLGIGGGG
jgi:hypothetical protein